VPCPLNSQGAGLLAWDCRREEEKEVRRGVPRRKQTKKKRRFDGRGPSIVFHSGDPRASPFANAHLFSLCARGCVPSHGTAPVTRTLLSLPLDVPNCHRACALSPLSLSRRAMPTRVLCVAEKNSVAEGVARVLNGGPVRGAQTW
jgi:hypothetical protein